MKKFIFTIIATVAVPIGFFVFLELALKLFQVGQPRAYFTEIEIDGAPHYQDNPFFIEQFYPRSLGITPIANTFANEPNANRLRVFVLGGSAARGFPNPNHGFSRHLEVMLKAAFPNKTVEVINTAMTSVNSHVIYETAKSIPGGPADFAIILVGNNEVVGPYGPGTYNQNFLSNLNLIRILQAVRRSRIWQALEYFTAEFQDRDAKETLRWRGMQMFTDNLVTQDNPQLIHVYDHYQSNLTDTIEILQGRGMQVLLSSVPVNLRDSAPFASAHSSNLTPGQIDQWQRHIRQGDLQFKRREFTSAIKNFESAIAIDSEFASTHFKLGICYENTGDFDLAIEHFRLARDYDVLRFRADSRMNAVIHSVAERLKSPSFHFVDNASNFARYSAPRAPGWNLLLEHVHFDFSGNYALAKEFFRTITGTLETKPTTKILSADEVAGRIGYPNHGTIDAMGRLLDMVQAPPFSGQSNHAALVEFINNKGHQLSQSLGSIPEVVVRRQALIRDGHADWWIDFELAELLGHQKDTEASFRHLERMIQAYPHHRGSRMKIASILQTAGRFDEAIPHLQRALDYARGDGGLLSQTMGSLGLTYFKNGSPQKATDILTDLIAQHSDQIDATLKAYGTLIRYAVSQGNQRELIQYGRALQQYADTLVRNGNEESYPELRQRVTQILRLGGFHREAQQWRSTIPIQRP